MQKKCAIGLFIIILQFGIGTALFSAESSYQFQGIKKIDLDLSMVNAAIKTHDKSEVGLTIILSQRLQDEGLKISHKQRGSTLEIHVSTNMGTQSLSMKSDEAKILLSVPHRVNIDVESNSGDAEFWGMSTDSVLFESSSGDVTFSNVTATLDVHTSSGDITIKNGTGSIKMKSSSGDLTVTDSKGEIVADSSSGDQTYQNVEGRLQAVSSSGEFKISGQKGGIRIETSSGEIEGQGIEVKGVASFATHSGDIDIDVTNPTENMAFELSSSSGQLTVGSIKAEKFLSIGAGENKIKGNSSSGDQTYK